MPFKPRVSNDLRLLSRLFRWTWRPVCRGKIPPASGELTAASDGALLAVEELREAAEELREAAA